ncbi:hypothetical protein ACA910_008607 [Epithemia clementina (nom. ined.)]
MFLLGLTALLLAGSVSGAGESQDPGRTSLPYTIEIPMQQNVPSAYVAYDIPPISIWFKTTVPSGTMTGNPQKDVEILRNTTATPFKKILGLFIKEKFALEIAKLAKEQPDSVNPLVFDFVSLDFQVTIHHDVVQQEGRRRSRLLGQLGSNGMWHLIFDAEFVGSAFFIKPLPGDIGADQLPSAEEMSDLMLSWLNKYFPNDAEILGGEILDDFRKSSSPILNNMDALHISTTGSPSMPTAVQEPEESPKTKWGHAFFTSLIIFACMSLVVVGFLLFRYSVPYILPYFQDHSIDPTHNTGSSLANVFPIHHYRSRTSTSDLHHDRALSPSRGGECESDHGKNDPLPGRRGDADEEMIIRAESDRWLKEHRPDLYEVVQKSTSSSSSVSAVSISTNSARPMDGPGDPNGESSQRRLAPLQFLFGGMFQSLKGKANQDAPPPPPLHHNENFVISDDNDIEAVFSEGLGPSLEGSPNWWGKVLQGLKGSKLACDEDPSTYDFPFQDFPRQDGTPCLIYSESGDGTSRVVRTENSDNANDSRPLSPTDPLSNDEFKRVLSLNSEDNNPLEEKKMEEDEFEDEIIFSSTQTDAPQFTEKLERLVAMRLRHYERQNLVQKHKKTREQRMQEESRQRELKLRRHEMELDMNEIEGVLAPRAIARRDRQSSEGNRSTSSSPTDPPGVDGSSLAPAVPLAMNDGRKPHHRSTASDPDFCTISSFTSTGSFDLNMQTSVGYIDAIMEGPEWSSPETATHSNHELRHPIPRLATNIQRNIAEDSEEEHEPARCTTKKRTEQTPLKPIYPAPNAVPSRTLQKAKMGRQRSHRRWSSHGTDPELKRQASVECLGDGRGRTTGSREDVMTFGIAAYTDFV